MPNDIYVHGSIPQQASSIRSYPMRNEFDLITLGFNKFPALSLSSDRGHPIVVNSLGTAVETTVGRYENEGNFATTGTGSTTFVQQLDQSFTLPATTTTWTTPNAARPYIWGLTISNNVTDPTNDITVAPGFAMCANESGSTSTGMLQLSLLQTINKRCDLAFSDGDGGGALASGLTWADGTWSVFLTQTNSNTDIIIDNTPLGTNAKATTGVSVLRRIGYILRVSGVILPFIQRGNRFLPVTHPTGSNATVTNDNAASTGMVGYAPSMQNAVIATGVHTVIALIRVWGRDGIPVGPVYWRFGWQSSTDLQSTATTETNAHLCSNIGRRRTGHSLLYMPAESSSSSTSFFPVRFRLLNATLSPTRGISSLGWIDFREPTFST